MDAALDLISGRPLPRSLAEAINHEFRTPLASLLGHLELVSEHDLPDDVLRSVAVMQRAALRLTALVAAAADRVEVVEVVERPFPVVAALIAS